MKTFHERLFYLGSKWRNPSLLSAFEFLMASQSWSVDQLQSFQLKKLQELLTFCSKSPFYHRVFEAIQFDPRDFKELSDLRKIPVTTKDDLLNFNAEIHTHAFEKTFFCETSGTSGQVLTFQRNEAWDSFNRAAFWRGYAWHGVNPWDRNIYFWGFNFSLGKKWKTRFFDGLQNRFRLFDYSAKSLERLKRFAGETVFLSGYSSMIYEFARILNRLPKKPHWPHLKMIKGTSEKIFPHYQEEIREAFGLPIISEYGAAESGIIAFECAHGKMHQNMEGVIVEQQDGEILVTNLWSHSFPVLRYRLGDVIRLGSNSSPCPCGQAHLVIEEVTGRTGCQIFGKNNVYPSLTFYYVFKNIFFEKGMKLNYQVHQWEPGVIEIWIRETLDDEKRKIIGNEIQKFFAHDIRYQIKHETNFLTMKGKLKDVISHLQK